MTTRCPKCLTSRTGDVLGAQCQTPGCGGTIEREPEWRELVDVLPEEHWCPRRAESFLAARIAPDPDHWERHKCNGQRVCSYCGSLHFDDFHALVRRAAQEPEDGDYHECVEIKPSDKRYKVYVHQPGVRNAGEGGIKFYMMHCPRDSEGKLTVTDEQNRDYAEAVRRSHLRFERYMTALYPSRAKAN